MASFLSGFTLIGERLNTHRERFKTRVAERDAESVVKEALRQQEAGVSHLDLNTSAVSERETEDMLWLLDTIMPALQPETGLAIDTASIECLKQALERLKGRGNTIINAISNDFQRIRDVLPLVVEHQASVIVILSSSASASRSADERLHVAEQLHALLCGAGVTEARQYYDPQLLPLAFDPQQPGAVLATVRELRRRWPAAHGIVGLSNISFNMPDRALLNRSYLSMLLASGIDGMLFDPCDTQLRQALIAARALLGQDEFLTTYLSEIGRDD